jgi:two-component system, LuxR family, sensor kinase FixL
LVAAETSLSQEDALTAVADSAALLQAILATVPDAMVLIDEYCVITSFSAAAEKLFCYGANEVLGKNVSMLMPEPHRSAHDGYIQRYLKTGEKRIIGIGRVVEGQRADGLCFQWSSRLVKHILENIARLPASSAI